MTETGTEPSAAEPAEVEPAALERVPIELTEAVLEALLFVAERPVQPPRDREPGGRRPGDRGRSPRRSRGFASWPRHPPADRRRSGRARHGRGGGALVARYVGADAVRLSPASLETLAIVAYRQPVTKSAIERIRGVDSDYTIRTLLHRRLVVELGRSEAPGRPFLYGTGFEFLERFGLTSLDELPPLDVDVAARLAEEGDEPMTRPLFPTDSDGTEG